MKTAVGMAVLFVQLFGLIFGTVRCWNGGRKDGDWLRGFPWLLVGIAGAPIIWLIGVIWK